MNSLKAKLSSAKMRARLRRNGCKLAPVLRNATSWSSTFHMFERYFCNDFAEAVAAIGAERSNFNSREQQNAFQDLIPTNEQKEQLQELLVKLNIINECTLYLQKANLNVLDVQNAIVALATEVNDEILINFIKQYCSDDCIKSENIDFISGSRRILEDPLAVTELTEDEKTALWKFRT